MPDRTADPQEAVAERHLRDVGSEGATAKRSAPMNSVKTDVLEQSAAEPSLPEEIHLSASLSSHAHRSEQAFGQAADQKSKSTPADAEKEISSTFATSSANPLNWTRKKRDLIVLCLALTGTISTSGSSIGVPGLHAAMKEFGVTDEKIGVLIPGAYVLGLGTGPFIFAPVSELYGRLPAYFVSQILYCIFFLGTGFSNHMATLIVLRFFCGVFGSVAPSLGIATCADMFPPEERGRPVSLYGLGPIAGPITGTMIGYWLLFLGWRWAYYFWTIVSVANTIFLILILRETYAPAIKKILLYHLTHPASQKAERDHHALSPLRLRWLPDLSWMRHMVSRADARAVYVKAFSRPPRLLFTNPVAFAFSMYYSYLYGVIYVFLISLPLLFGKPPFSQPALFSYLWPQATLPLAYIPIGMGFATAVTLAATYQDKIYKYLSEKNGDKGQPEYRLVLAQLGMFIMPVGLLIFGWTSHSEHHWMGPFVGQFLIGIGLMLAFNTLQAFFVDAFFPYSAAAIAGATACRSIVACILPLFTTDMFVRLGWGWGGTLLALVAVLGLPCPMIMFVCGKRLREKYAFHG